jgi:hypothetical protein
MSGHGHFVSALARDLGPLTTEEEYISEEVVSTTADGAVTTWDN